MSENIVKQLIRHEGLKLKPYYCTGGKLTIGVGRNLTDTGISEDEAMYLLENDIKRCEKEARENLPFFNTLDEVRQMVLINMCFNLGIKGLLGFKNTLVLIEKGDYAGAATNMLNSKWAAQVGNRAKELAELMRSGATEET